MPRTKGSKNKPKVVNDFVSQIAEKQSTIESLAEEAKKAEAEAVLKKLLADGMSAEEILAKLK